MSKGHPVYTEDFICKRRMVHEGKQSLSSQYEDIEANDETP